MPVEIKGFNEPTQTPETQEEKTQEQAPETAPEPQPEEPVAQPEPPRVEPAVSSAPSDPMSITVTISDTETPIVVLYGPPSSGKTMALVRLARYLKDEGYQVVPDRNFRGSQDSSYTQLCDNFDSIISSNDAADSTTGISFMLVKVLNSMGHPICQILEAPGEHYYPATSGYPPYISRIINSKNRKIWAVILEPLWENEVERRVYVDNIRRLNGKLNNRSKVLFVYNKIDMTHAKTMGDTIKEVKDTYRGIFEPFRNQNPITKMWKEYNCNLVRFTTGDYAEKVGGGRTYTPSDDSYPKELWNVMLKMIKG